MYEVSFLARCPPNCYLSKELNLRVSLSYCLAIYLTYLSVLPPSSQSVDQASTVIIRFTILFTIVLPWGKIQYPGILQGEVLQWWFCALAEYLLYRAWETPTLTMITWCICVMHFIRMSLKHHSWWENNNFFQATQLIQNFRFHHCNIEYFKI